MATNDANATVRVRASYLRELKDQCGAAAMTIACAETELARQREVIEKWNEIDKANTAKIEELEKRIDLGIREHAAAEAARRAAEAARNQAFNETTELKARLHDAETQLARMRGYVDRVHDLDEIGREPLTTITERTERPRRRDRVDMALSGDGCTSNGERRRHWTSYGQ